MSILYSQIKNLFILDKDSDIKFYIISVSTIAIDYIYCY